ncbi:hypothetical protein SAMN05421643_1348 [Acinetobacter kyonggiensis]|uniref:Uncharacterized protein n=1 Tax=Acinetobacter kyonggiensis TaxID=595670 RepID=A0A1H3MZP1_9GAMM|nr:hypothetical protein SAMN05421643_1348 [Acinetobacter kyonggiensis]
MSVTAFSVLFLQKKCLLLHFQFCFCRKNVCYCIFSFVSAEKMSVTAFSVLFLQKKCLLLHFQFCFCRKNVCYCIFSFVSAEKMSVTAFLILFLQKKCLLLHVTWSCLLTYFLKMYCFQYKSSRISIKKPNHLDKMNEIDDYFV